jgi:hypothetical protein
MAAGGRMLSRLFVLWRDLQTGTRHTIGELRRSAGYEFTYRLDDVTRAQAVGFELLTEFPKLSGDPYRSGYLFATFAQRIPSPKRPDYCSIMQSWGIEDRDDSLLVLARSGGIQITDRLELAEYRDSDDDLTQPLVFRLAGSQHSSGAEHVADGEELRLAWESGNVSDQFATLVVRTNHENIGYVPRQYSQLVSSLLRSETRLETRAIRRMLAPASAGRLLVEVRRGP